MIGIDRDPAALAIAAERLAVFGDRFRPVRTTFDEVDDELTGGPVDGVLYDLGVSSMQLDRAERGFGYRDDGPLDMRMAGADDDEPTAADLVNELPEEELANLIYEFGGERRSRRIARAIVRRRAITDPPTELARRGRGRSGTTSGGPPPRASHVPGAPHRGQPGARGARRLPASGGRAPRSRWPRGRDRVPLARGPHREATFRDDERLARAHEEAAACPSEDEVAREPAGAQREASARPSEPRWRRERSRTRTSPLPGRPLARRVPSPRPAARPTPSTPPQRRARRGSTPPSGSSRRSSSRRSSFLVVGLNAMVVNTTYRTQAIEQPGASPPGTARGSRPIRSLHLVPVAHRGMGATSWAWSMPGPGESVILRVPGELPRTEASNGDRSGAGA